MEDYWFRTNIENFITDSSFMPLIPNKVLKKIINEGNQDQYKQSDSIFEIKVYDIQTHVKTHQFLLTLTQSDDIGIFEQLFLQTLRNEESLFVLIQEQKLLYIRNIELSTNNANINTIISVCQDYTEQKCIKNLKNFQDIFDEIDITEIIRVEQCENPMTIIDTSQYKENLLILFDILNASELKQYSQHLCEDLIKLDLSNIHQTIFEEIWTQFINLKQQNKEDFKNTIYKKINSYESNENYKQKEFLHQALNKNNKENQNKNGKVESLLIDFFDFKKVSISFTKQFELDYNFLQFQKLLFNQFLQNLNLLLKDANTFKKLYQMLLNPIYSRYHESILDLFDIDISYKNSKFIQLPNYQKNEIISKIQKEFPQSTLNVQYLQKELGNQQDINNQINTIQQESKQQQKQYIHNFIKLNALYEIFTEPNFDYLFFSQILQEENEQVKILFFIGMCQLLRNLESHQDQQLLKQYLNLFDQSLLIAENIAHNSRNIIHIQDVILALSYTYSQKSAHKAQNVINICRTVTLIDDDVLQYRISQLLIKVVQSFQVLNFENMNLIINFILEDVLPKFQPSTFIFQIWTRVLKQLIAAFGQGFPSLILQYLMQFIEKFGWKEYFCVMLNILLESDTATATDEGKCLGLLYDSLKHCNNITHIHHEIQIINNLNSVNHFKCTEIVTQINSLFNGRSDLINIATEQSKDCSTITSKIVKQRQDQIPSNPNGFTEFIRLITNWESNEFDSKYNFVENTLKSYLKHSELSMFYTACRQILERQAKFSLEIIKLIVVAIENILILETNTNLLTNEKKNYYAKMRQKFVEMLVLGSTISQREKISPVIQSIIPLFAPRNSKQFKDFLILQTSYSEFPQGKCKEIINLVKNYIKQFQESENQEIVFGVPGILIGLGIFMGYYTRIQEKNEDLEFIQNITELISISVEISEPALQLYDMVERAGGEYTDSDTIITTPLIDEETTQGYQTQKNLILDAQATCYSMVAENIQKIPIEGRNVRILELLMNQATEWMGYGFKGIEECKMLARGIKLFTSVSCNCSVFEKDHCDEMVNAAKSFICRKEIQEHQMDVIYESLQFLSAYITKFEDYLVSNDQDILSKCVYLIQNQVLDADERDSPTNDEDKNRAVSSQKYLKMCDAACYFLLTAGLFIIQQDDFFLELFRYVQTMETDQEAIVHAIRAIIKLENSNIMSECQQTVRVLSRSGAVCAVEDGMDELIKTYLGEQ